MYIGNEKQINLSIKKNVPYNSIHILYNYQLILWSQFLPIHKAKLDTSCCVVNDRLTLWSNLTINTIQHLLSTYQMQSTIHSTLCVLPCSWHSCLRALTPATPSTQKFFPHPAYPDHSIIISNTISEWLSLMTLLLWSTSSCLFHHYLKYFWLHLCLPHQNVNSMKVLVCLAHCYIPIPRTAPGTQQCFSKYSVNEWTT